MPPRRFMTMSVCNNGRQEAGEDEGQAAGGRAGPPESAARCAQGVPELTASEVHERRRERPHSLTLVDCRNCEEQQVRIAFLPS